MTSKIHTIAICESLKSSIVSDCFTFAVVAGLVLLADGRSIAWQLVTVGLFIFWVAGRISMGSKVRKFYSKRDLVEWAQALPDDKEGGAS